MLVCCECLEAWWPGWRLAFFVGPVAGSFRAAADVVVLHGQGQLSAPAGTPFRGRVQGVPQDAAGGVAGLGGQPAAGILLFPGERFLAKNLQQPEAEQRTLVFGQHGRRCPAEPAGTVQCLLDRAICHLDPPAATIDLLGLFQRQTRSVQHVRDQEPFFPCLSRSNRNTHGAACDWPCGHSQTSWPFW